MEKVGLFDHFLESFDFEQFVDFSCDFRIFTEWGPCHNPIHKVLHHFFIFVFVELKRLSLFGRLDILALSISIFLNFKFHVPFFFSDKGVFYDLESVDLPFSDLIKHKLFF